MLSPFPCLCGSGRAQVRSRVTIADAPYSSPSARHDPTGTATLRAKFRRDMDRRWDRVKRLTVQALGETDTPFGLEPSVVSVHASLGSGNRVKAFQQWLDEALRQVVYGYTGIWTEPYIDQAFRIAKQRAAVLTGVGVIRSSQDAYNDAGPPDEPRDKTGEWTSGGGSGRSASVLTKARDVAAKLNFPASKIKVDEGERPLPQHVLSGEMDYAAAESNLQNGEITVYPKHTSDEALEGNVAHEIGHQKFQHYLGGKWKENNVEALAHQLGDPHVSNYGESYWKSAERGDVSWTHAVHENMAEMSRLHYQTGKVPGSPEWQKFYNRVNHVWDFDHKKTTDAAPYPDREAAILQLTASELDGICSAASQRATRVMTHGLLANTKPQRLARAVAERLSKVGKDRSRMLVNAMVVKAFSSATLDAFRQAGVGQVGTIAERKPVKVAKGPHGLHVVDRGPYKTKVQRRVDLSSVDVLTAGDADVCELCEDISDNGPYDLDEAEALIPAHINCRCVFVPSDDLRFASVHEDDIEDAMHDAGPEDEPRNERGEWTSGGGSLPMDPASRLARAREQGFDTSRVVYHGSPDARGIEEAGFQTPKERLLHQEDPDRAFFFTDDPKMARTYAKAERAWDYQNAEPKVINAYLRMKNPMEIDWGGKPWHGTEQVIAKAKAAGHDGVIIRRVLDNYSKFEKGIKKPTTVRVVFDPENIRSTDAAFHPEKTASHLLKDNN